MSACPEHDLGLHDWRERMFADSLAATNVKVLPVITTDPHQPRNCMRPGQSYHCERCGMVISVKQVGGVEEMPARRPLYATV